MTAVPMPSCVSDHRASRAGVCCRLTLMWGAVLAGCATGPSSPTAVVTLDGDVATVTLDGEPFATVHAGAARPFVHPLLAPGGIAVTRPFPMEQVPGEATDHPHHVSMWFAHGDVSGFDFWQGQAHQERLALDGAPTVRVADGVAIVCAKYRWLADADTVVGTEHRELAFGGFDGARTVDVAVTLHAMDRPLVLGDTKEGTFAVRVRQLLCVDGKGAAGQLLDSEGRRNADVWGKRARWIDDHGAVAGREVGITMFDHPQNHGHPTWWHARTYGLLAANPFGVHDFEKKPAGTGTLTVPPGGELRLRYRVLLHGGDWDGSRIDAAWRAWAAR
ncbi:MAG: PmoA family protein [Planctomycetota bacterium]